MQLTASRMILFGFNLLQYSQSQYFIWNGVSRCSQHTDIGLAARVIDECHQTLTAAGVEQAKTSTLTFGLPLAERV